MIITTDSTVMEVDMLMDMLMLDLFPAWWYDASLDGGT